MRLQSYDQCVAYVDSELDRLRQLRPDWHWGHSTDVPVAPLKWTVGRDFGEYYTLEARMDYGEFVIWFGHHQVGAEGLHWIMQTAVHVAFEDLQPREDALAIRYGLSDVLDNMICTLNSPPQFLLRFATNTHSLT